MARAIEYMNAHLAEKVTLEEVCSLVSRSPAQLNRVFKKETGRTPYDHLLDQRLARARMLLAHTFKPIKEVAFTTGFTDEYYFSNLFKQKCG